MVSWPLWELGYPDQAMQRSQEALALAHTLAPPTPWLRQGLRLLAEAPAIEDASEGRRHAAEIYRLRGELLLR